MKTIQFKSTILVFIVLANILVSFTSCVRNSIHQKIAKQTNEISNKLIKIRRDLHQYPELAGYEQRTSKVVAQYLSNLGLEVKIGVAGHGVIGILKGGREGKNIAWRADMDAIPGHFPEQAPYKSKVKGIQHGCGHDVHMAIGLGIAEILSNNKESLKGTVYFIFQPEEETFVGAKNIADSNLYSALNIDEIYALHVTALPLGQLMVRPNELYAYQKIIEIKFNNELSKDDAEVLHKELRKEILRKKEATSPWEIPRAFDTIAGLSNPNTIFKDYLFIDERFYIDDNNNQLTLIASAYETNESNLADILPKIEQIIRKSEYNDKFISMSYIQENPTVLNHESLTKNAMNTLTNIYGNNAVILSHGQVPYFNDDFIYFQQKTPGVYFLLGGSNLEKGINAMNHTPNFDVDEDCIAVGVKSFSSLILERLAN
jgi:metal-dependent amidase/aminoacylase/carboxypeptidase family protein